VATAYLYQKDPYAAAVLLVDLSDNQIWASAGLRESLHDACSALKEGAARGASSSRLTPPKCSPSPDDVDMLPSGCCKGEMKRHL
jgi:hypothetical protein